MHLGTDPIHLGAFAFDVADIRDQSFTFIATAFQTIVIDEKEVICIAIFAGKLESFHGIIFT
ncbi:hypothetical protein D3C72_2072410 [compost metagenome]